MYVSDILASYAIPSNVKHSLIEYMIREHIQGLYLEILTPTATNDDINGSQHATGGGTDFTYREAEVDDIAYATTLGHYEYFAATGDGNYTGHSYNGEGTRFSAIVVDPPSYAVGFVI